MGDRSDAQIEGLLEDTMMFLDVIGEKGKRDIPFGAVAPNGVLGGSVSPNREQVVEDSKEPWGEDREWWRPHTMAYTSAEGRGGCRSHGKGRSGGPGVFRGDLDGSRAAGD